VTGYLQRLVTAAVQGTAGIHPIVRPPGTEPRAGEPAWTEFGDETEPHLGEGTAPAEITAVPTATAVPAGPPPGDDQPAPPAGPVRDRVAAEPSRVPEIMTPLFAERPAADPATPDPATPVPATPDPATPVPATPVPATPVPAARIGGVTRPPVTRRSRPGPPADHPGGSAGERSNPADPAHSALQPAAARSGPAALPPSRQESRRRASPATPGRAEGGDRGGEVEIHIGRIEVTAVSAPPAAPVAKAARKSISLSEYLRNGR
jgi:hypothetical protein